MDPAKFIATYGYLAVIVGTFFEGEMIMLAAGVAASVGWLNLPLAIAAGMTGIFASDTVCFLIGRLAGDRLERWFPRLHARLSAVFRMIERHDEKLLIFFQFFPGLCTVTPLAFGMTRIRASRFMILDLLGNASWTLTFSIGGYLFGAAMSTFMGGLQPWFAGASVAVGVLILGLAYWRLRGWGQKLFAQGSAPSE